jgi:predicted RNase H-like nuclease (RuvC/YqgF family)
MARRLTLGGDGSSGILHLVDDQGQSRIAMYAEVGDIKVGGRGVDGDITVFSQEAADHHPNKATIHLDGETGDIKLHQLREGVGATVAALSNRISILDTKVSGMQRDIQTLENKVRSLESKVRQLGG